MTSTLQYAWRTVFSAIFTEIFIYIYFLQEIIDISSLLCRQQFIKNNFLPKQSYLWQPCYYLIGIASFTMLNIYYLQYMMKQDRNKGHNLNISFAFTLYF